MHLFHLDPSRSQTSLIWHRCSVKFFMRKRRTSGSSVRDSTDRPAGYYARLRKPGRGRQILYVGSKTNQAINGPTKPTPQIQRTEPLWLQRWGVGYGRNGGRWLKGTDFQLQNKRACGCTLVVIVNTTGLYVWKLLRESSLKVLIKGHLGGSVS